MSFGTMPPSNAPSSRSSVGAVGVDQRHHRTLEVDARDIGDEDDALCADARRDRRRGLVRVDVQRADRDRRDDRNAPGSSCSTTASRRDGSGSPTRPRSASGVACRPISSPTQVNRRGAECGGELGPDGDQRRAHDGEGRWIREATTADEAHGDAARLQLRGDLRAGAVHDDDLVARPRAARARRRASRPRRDRRA